MNRRAIVSADNRVTFTVETAAAEVADLGSESKLAARGRTATNGPGRCDPCRRRHPTCSRCRSRSRRLAGSSTAGGEAMSPRGAPGGRRAGGAERARRRRLLQSGLDRASTGWRSALHRGPTALCLRPAIRVVMQSVERVGINDVYRSGAGAAGSMTLAMVVLLGLAITGIVLGVHLRRWHKPTQSGHLRNEPSREDVLAERFARGEIDEDEFRRRMRRFRELRRGDSRRVTTGFG